jgi:excisionase family DNA binding protein
MQAIRLPFFSRCRAAVPAVEGLIDSVSGYGTSSLVGDEVMTKLSEYVKTAEAAEILGVAQNTIRKWAENGTLPVRRNPANGYRLFKRSDLNAFLRNVEKSSRSSVKPR